MEGEKTQGRCIVRIKVTGLVFILVAFLAVSPAAASITVTTDPCLIVKGQNCTIGWTSYGTMADRVNVTVWYGATLVTQFNNVPNVVGGTENTQVWPMPSSAATGTYKFRVATIDGLVQGESEQPVNERGLYLAGPGPSGTLEMDSSCPIGWHGFGLPGSSGAVLDLYRSGALVGQIGIDVMNSSHGCGRTYYWKVGHLLDPATEEPAAETVPAGAGYFIRVRQMSGSYYADTSQFAIALNFDWLRDKFRHLRRISIYRIPKGPDPCPMCAELQLQEFFEVMKLAPKRYEVELWASGKSLGRLIKSSQAQRPVQRIDFGDAFAQLEKGGGGFELRVFDARGRLVHKQAVTLQFSDKTPLTRK